MQPLVHGGYETPYQISTSHTVLNNRNKLYKTGNVVYGIIEFKMTSNVNTWGSFTSDIPDNYRPVDTVYGNYIEFSGYKTGTYLLGTNGAFSTGDSLNINDIIAISLCYVCKG
jgi:hypothetical protein